MDCSYIIYILIFYIIFHFKHDVLFTEKPLRGVFNKVLSYLINVDDILIGERECSLIATLQGDKKIQDKWNSRVYKVVTMSLKLSLPMVKELPEL